MALALRNTLFWLVAATVVLVQSCALGPGNSNPSAGSGSQTNRRTPEKPLDFSDKSLREGFDKVLILLFPSATSEQVWQSYSEELRDEFDVVTRVIKSSTTPAEVAAFIDATGPVGLTLVGNGPLNLYRKYLESYPQRSVLPSLVMMSSYLRDVYAGKIPRSTGIAYEIPAVSVFLSLRALANTPVRKIGVIYRPLLKGFISRQREPAKREGLELVEIELKSRPEPGDLRRAIQSLLEHKVDAVWVLNDNALLKPAFIQEGWRPGLGKSKVTVVVGVEPLVSKALRFGGFAVLPNHLAMGAQAADLWYSFADSKWDAVAVPIQDPFSVESVVNLSLVDDSLALKPQDLNQIDRVIH